MLRRDRVLLLFLLLCLSRCHANANCDPGDETCAWDAATPADTSSAKPSKEQCHSWAAQGECDKNPSYMRVECRAACQPNKPSEPLPPAADSDPHCPMWAGRGECEKNPEFMARGCAQACQRHAESLKDKDPKCAEWAAAGDCDTRRSWMMQNCKGSCLRALQDQADATACAGIVASGACATSAGLATCRASCLAALQQRLSPDTEGNCWYWGTDGECTNNSVWMRKTCPRTCDKLEACSRRPHSAECAAPFECPVANDERLDCASRALRGECRPGSLWTSSATLRTCGLSCHLLDPPSVSHAATRPATRRNAWVDAPTLTAPHFRHAPARCDYGAPAAALLSGRCPNLRRSPAARARCPHLVARMTPRLPHPEVSDGQRAALAAAAPLPALVGDAPPKEPWNASRVRVTTVWPSPRVRLVHDIVTAEEAAHLIAIATPHFTRSTTARAGSDGYRTSESSMLPGSDPVVRALRQRISHLVGYPEAALEPLQGVRYVPGQHYKPHHDFYNACETWQDGNRHFTFLVYLNRVGDGGGQTGFPMLNLSVETRAYAALLFNNCLDNGEPDERSQHEGVAPLRSTKYAINGWMRAKHLGGR